MAIWQATRNPYFSSKFNSSCHYDYDHYYQEGRDNMSTGPCFMERDTVCAFLIDDEIMLECYDKPAM